MWCNKIYAGLLMERRERGGGKERKREREREREREGGREVGKKWEKDWERDKKRTQQKSVFCHFVRYT